MKKTEELKNARTELKELAGIIAKGEATDDQKARAKALNDDVIPELQDAVDAIAEDAELLSGIMANVSAEEPADADAEPKFRTVGAKAAASVAGNMERGRKGSVIAEYKADTISVPSSIQPAITDYDTNLVLQNRRRLYVADLFGSETVSGNALTYFVEGAITDATGVIGEGGVYGQSTEAEPTAVTETLKKVGHYYKETDELLADADRLAKSIDNRMAYLIDKCEEEQLLNGDGTGMNITGILGRDGIQAQTCKTGATDIADAIETARQAIRTASVYEADGIVINPNDWLKLRIAKDGNGQYYAGGFFTGAYGNGAPSNGDSFWGLRAVVTSAIPQGTMLVGAFAQGGAVVRKGGTTIEVSNSNEDDFIRGQVTIRGTKRLALAVRYPAAFVKVTIAD